jgi:hypothetical protein
MKNGVKQVNRYQREAFVPLIVWASRLLIARRIWLVCSKALIRFAKKFYVPLAKSIAALITVEL